LSFGQSESSRARADQPQLLQDGPRSRRSVTVFGLAAIVGSRFQRDWV
jgi:hypothetical protein